MEKLDLTVLLATVVRTRGSSPRPVGSIMALCESGAVAANGFGPEQRMLSIGAGQLTEYVDAIGSPRNNEARHARLIEHFDQAPESLARLRGPTCFLPSGSP